MVTIHLTGRVTEDGELVFETPKSGKEVIEAGLTGGWEDMGITDSVAWVEEQRRKERERNRW